MASPVIAETKRAPRQGRRRVLLVIDERCPSHGLCPVAAQAAAPDAVQVLVVAPTHGSRAMRWTVDEDAARADASDRLRTCVSCLTGDGIEADGRLADPDPVHAIADALHDFAADEILLVSTPQRPSTWLHESTIDRVRRSFPLPVEHVVAPPAA